VEDVRAEVLSPREESAGDVLHLYCVVGDGMEMGFGPIGLGGREVFPVRHAGLAAMVSRSPMRAYAAMTKDQVVPFLFAHQAVIEKVMRTETVVPVKFGTTARDAAEVWRMLERGRGRLAAALAAMEGKIELDVVALWKDLKPTLEEIADREEIRTRKATISRRPFEETRAERIELGRLLEAELDLVREQRAAEIVEALASVGEALCPHALVDERMIVNVALLVQRSKEPELRDRLGRLNERYGDRIDFRCVGPLPPYSFSMVEVRWFPFPAVDGARELLGLGERATPAEVKEAYYRVAWRSHPDGHGPNGGGEVPFDEVTAANRILTEYCEAGGRSFREPDVGRTVGVRLVGRAAEAKRA
jgi:hypothetical protein